MPGFEFATTHRVLVEAGAARLPGLCQERGSRVLLVTDPGIRSTPLLEPVEDSFRQAGMPLTVFDQVSADPAIPLCWMPHGRRRKRKQIW